MPKAYLYDLTDTWDAVGTTFTAIKMSVTDSASAAGSLLMDLRVGGTSQTQVNKAGKVLASTTFLTGGFGGIGETTGICFRGGAIEFYNSGPQRTGIFGSNFKLGSGIGLAWSDSADAGGGTDLSLFRDAADTLAQRRSTNAQAFRVYNTFTDASNYERLTLRNATGYWRIHPEKAGSGTDQHIGVYNTGQQSGTNWDANGWTTYTAGVDRWRINTTGHLIASTDNTYDIGASGANRPRFLYLGGGSLTGSAADSSLTISPTWNTTGTPTAILANVTDTASNGASLLMDLRVGGTSRFNVNKNGRVHAIEGILQSPSIATGWFFQNTANFGYVASGIILSLYSTGETVIGGQSGSGASLFADAADTLAQRRSTNAQAFRVYNTFTDASNYERAGIYWSSNQLFVATEAAGTGSQRLLNLQGSSIEFRTATSTRWVLNSSGHLVANVDNTYDIGASGATRPRNVYVAGVGEFGGNFSVGGNILAANGLGRITSAGFSTTSAGVLRWASGSDSNAGPFDLRLVRSAAGVLLLDDNASSFSRLQFGGTTSSFPSLKRSSTVLQARLADDSDFAPMQGQLRTHSAYTAGAPTATGYLVLYDSNGTAYKVPAEAL